MFLSFKLVYRRSIDFFIADLICPVFFLTVWYMINNRKQKIRILNKNNRKQKNEF